MFSMFCIYTNFYKHIFDKIASPGTEKTRSSAIYHNNFMYDHSLFQVCQKVKRIIEGLKHEKILP